MNDSTTKVRADVGERVKKKPRKLVYQMRLNEDEAELLDIISYATEDTKADVLRKALKMYASVSGKNY